MPVQAVILAAGLGKRMYSKLPKVLHLLGGKPLLSHVIATARAISKERTPIIVYGHEGEQLLQQFSGETLQFVEQTEQLGTGHALQQALPHLNEKDRVLVLYGDVPLLTCATLQTLVQSTGEKELGMVTAQLDHPFGYGRILRDSQGAVVGIVEEKDADLAQREIKEVNSGIYLIPATYLKKWLPTLTRKNAQGEYYLTEVIAKAVSEHINIVTVQPHHADEIFGINDKAQLAHAERVYQKRVATKLMQAGLTLMDPSRFDVRGEVSIGRDVTIDVNVILEGNVTIGDACVIGANCHLRNVMLGNHVEIKPNSVLDGANVADECVIGPFARLRPQTTLASSVHIGNFVEVKKSNVGAGSKINHLTYVGDSEIGKHVNVGAGTITCNYDGVSKHQTTIGDDVFIGSGTLLVAPIKVGNNATIGAGTTVIHDAPANQLTINRKEQRQIADWVRQTKKKDS